MQYLYILLTPERVQYCVGFFSTLPLFHGTVRGLEAAQSETSQNNFIIFACYSNCKRVVMHVVPVFLGPYILIGDLCM